VHVLEAVSALSFKSFTWTLLLAFLLSLHLILTGWIQENIMQERAEKTLRSLLPFKTFQGFPAQHIMN
jgi:hypothetical protein